MTCLHLTLGSILKVYVKAMNISTVDILETVSYKSKYY